MKKQAFIDTHNLIVDVNPKWEITPLKKYEYTTRPSLKM